MRRASYKCLDDLKQEGIHPSVVEGLDQAETLMKMIHGKKNLKDITIEELTSLN